MTQRMESAGKTILVMAGGTGGHVFPALAVAQNLQQRGWHVEWLGTETGIEARVVEQANIPITYIKIAGLRGKGLLRKLLAPIKLLGAVMQSLSAVRRIQPDCVLGMGGFASGPGGVAAWLTGRPLIIHEQNAIAGLTNKLLYRIAKTVLAAFPGAFGETGAAKEQCVGNPLREVISTLPEPNTRMAERQGPLRLLVLGGSLGALVLNETVPESIALVPEQQRPEIWHQTGRDRRETTLQAYENFGFTARVDEFIEDMGQAYEWADLIICRSGALTVSEIACVGLASILVPYPHAVDDHQTANARYLEAPGAAIILPQNELSAQSLAELLSEKFSQRSAVIEMAKKAREVARHHATDRVADYCVEACHV